MNKITKTNLFKQNMSENVICKQPLCSGFKFEGINIYSISKVAFYYGNTVTSKCGYPCWEAVSNIFLLWIPSLLLMF